MQFYLASNSPRRRELLANLGFKFEIIAADIDETPFPNEKATDYVWRMAVEKNRAAREKLAPNAPHFSLSKPVLTADTSVIFAQQILGKPENEQHAAQMLRLLSGKTHQVITTICLADAQNEKVVQQISQVRFKPLTEQEIQAYIATGEPMDKAGAYGIQQRGGVFVEHIEGSFTGIMGLPIFETVELLKGFNITMK